MESAQQAVAEKEPQTRAAQPERTRSGRYYRPSVDIIEHDDELVLHADMPGVTPEDFDIHFENGILSITGRVKPRQAEGTQYLWREYGVGDFYRTFQVSEEIDSTRISAEYRHGVLILHLPKVEQARPRRIEVRSGE